MAVTFREALRIAQSRYPHPINRYEEYERYFVFEHDDGREHAGGEFAPIVIRKEDGEALNYSPIFLGIWPDAEDVGEIVSQGTV